MTDVTLDVVHLVKGDDDVSLRIATLRIVHALTGDLDPGVAVEEVGQHRSTPRPTLPTRRSSRWWTAQTLPSLANRPARWPAARSRCSGEGGPGGAFTDYLTGSAADHVAGAGVVGRAHPALTDAVAASGGVVVDTSLGPKTLRLDRRQVAASGLRLDRRLRAHRS